MDESVQGHDIYDIDLHYDSVDLLTMYSEDYIDLSSDIASIVKNIIINSHRLTDLKTNIDIDRAYPSKLFDIGHTAALAACLLVFVLLFACIFRRIYVLMRPPISTAL